MAPNTNSGAIFNKLKIVYISNFIIFDPEISSYCDKRQFFPFPRCVKNGRQRVDLGQLSPPQDHDVALCMYRRARSFHVIYACCVRSWSHQTETRLHGQVHEEEVAACATTHGSCTLPSRGNGLRFSSAFSCRESNAWNVRVEDVLRETVRRLY